MASKQTLGLVLVVLFSVVGIATMPAAAEQPTGEPRQIDSCTTITEPGHYVLTQDIENVTDTCIRVQADDVTLDGQGHTLSGVQNESNRTAFTNASLAPGEALAAGNVSNESFDALVENYPTPQNPRWDNVGVAVNGTTSLSNVSVQNLTVRTFAFGIYYDNVTDGSVTDITAADNGDGLEMYNTTDLSVTDSRLTGNEWGAFVWNASNATVANVSADGGFVALNVAEAAGLDVRNVSMTNNSGAGLVLDYVTHSAVTDLNVTDSGYLGVFLGSSSDVTISDSTLSGTVGEAPRTTPFPDSAALALHNASQNTIVNTTAVANENWTYYAYSNSTANTAENLSLDGFTVSFIATDVALDAEPTDTNRTNESGPGRLVIENTSENSSIDVQATWRLDNVNQGNNTSIAINQSRSVRQMHRLRN